MSELNYLPIGEVWDGLAATWGRKCVMGRDEIDEATLDAETDRQKQYLAPLVKSRLFGHEKIALDYGCGAGRFISMLGDLLPTDHIVVGFDPSHKMVSMAPPPSETVLYCAGPVPMFFDHMKARNLLFDLVFMFNVLGGTLDDDLQFVAEWIEQAMAPMGLLILCEHTEKKREGTWWHFRPMQVYADLFKAVKLRRVGECMQLENSVTIMAGRK